MVTETAAFSSTNSIRAGNMLDEGTFNTIRHRLILNACKWDPQVGDVETISRFPLILSPGQWRELSDRAGQLTHELLAAEAELLHRPELQGLLGLPRGIRQVLRNAPTLGLTPPAARVLRFDFHWTDQGWKISEVNSDVPGGFSEASELPALVAEHVHGARPAGHPGDAWADSIAASAIADHAVALLTAPGFMEDRQVLSYLAQLLEARGIPSHWAQPGDLAWENGLASLNAGTSWIALGAIVRFYQAEWLKPRRVPQLFVGGRTPVANPGSAALSESKRFPLIWDKLTTRMSAWRELLPETRDPRDAPWKTDDRWLVKSAMCNTGDTVAIRDLLGDRQWIQVRRAVWFNPGRWIAQRRFNAIPVQSPVGPIYPCVGVYTINGQTAGIYGRFSKQPVIDYQAVDVAVLVAEHGGILT